MQKTTQMNVSESQRLGLAFVSPPSRNEYTAVEGTFTFTYAIDSESRAHIIRCKGDGEALRIPNKLGGCDVIALEHQACAHLMRIASIELPETLVSIGPRSFEGCLSLGRIKLPGQLETIGSEAFLLCPSLERVRIPQSVRHLGANVTGMRNASRLARNTRLIIDEGNPHLFADAHGILYERSGCELIAIDGCSYAKETLELDCATTAIGPFAFAQNCAITQAVLPEGVREIGESAFRGCTQLASVTFPSTLQTIRNGAFACTRLASARIPASCTLIESTALNTGSANLETLDHPYASTLASIDVAPENPVYCMHGGLLCKRIEGTDSLEAILCAREAKTVHLDERIDHVARAALCGTVRIETLRVRERLSFAQSRKALAHIRCGVLIIDCADDTPYNAMIRLEMPRDGLGEQILEAGLAEGNIDVEKLLAAYDATIPRVDDPALRARLMLARLAEPKLLGTSTQRLFANEVLSSLASLIVYFGTRQYWNGYRQLFQAHMLTQANIGAMVALLSEYGDTAANAYLLELKREYFGSVCWDYEL